MLEALRQIAEELNQTLNPHQMLDRVVSIVQGHLAVDVCSIYRADVTGDNYVLMATGGLDPSLVGRMRLPRDDSLIGYVAKQGKTLVLRDASAHPRNCEFPPLRGDQHYHAFMGVPIMRRRTALGVLAVRDITQRQFTRDEENWLIAVAAELAGALEDEAITAIESVLDTASPHSSRILRGIAAAPGLAVGEVVLPAPEADLDAVPDREPSDVLAEENRFRTAVTQVQADLRSHGAQLAIALPATDVHVLFNAYTLLLGDSHFFEDVRRRIHAGNWAPGALRATIEEYARVFDAMEDAYLRVRAEDIRGLGRRILLRLQVGSLKPREYPKHCVLAGEEISITRIADVPTEQLVGIICNQGSRYSHATILARTLGIPAVVGLRDLPLKQMEGRTVVVDGEQGNVFVEPSPTLLQQFQQTLHRTQDHITELKAQRDLPAITPDGQRISLQANAGLPADIERALAWGAEGIGLYRTEYGFVMSEGFPSEDSQFELYREVLTGLAPKPVTMRTLDIGGDKGLPYFPVMEANPYLGWRGIRLTLDTPGILVNQLRAMLRANAGCDNLRILFPMVSTARQIDEACALLERAREDLRQGGQTVAKPAVGVMIEVPSAVYQIRALARRVDFFAIGSNDLTQYILAVDRGNARVAKLYDSLHPAVIAVIAAIARTARRYGKPVGVCGEMAGDPAAVILLLGMGIDEISMTAVNLARTKAVIRSFTQSQSRRLLLKALRMEEADQVRALLNDALAKAGLDDAITTTQIFQSTLSEDTGSNQTAGA
ncbi:MAG: phosphoenolpyruvate--protein phosphotransferase [Gammaproteobacteria bacterium]|nr:phosphoenolpyruvate--protein phosphotransferase [Gammaproteobacteria bacterium]MCP5425840.1 phosphoenolpyruvate--protein phosphotransferase [Gammaproteobacteria bacterium]